MKYSKILKTFIASFIFLNFLLVGSASAIDISNCTNLNQSGETYYLTADITDSNISYCMNMSANNTVLDCQGHIIEGNGSASYGIYLSRSSEQTTNNTIRNCTLTNWATNQMYLNKVNGNFIEDVNISSGTGANTGLLLSDSNSNSITNFYSQSNYRGLMLVYSDSNTIIDSTSYYDGNVGVGLSLSCWNNLSNITVYQHGSVGFSLRDDSSNNIIKDSTFRNPADNEICFYTSNDEGKNGANLVYNNYFNCSNVFYHWGLDYYNYANTTRQTGTREISTGTEIGGNYWANPSGTGFSETCIDSNKDGFCDTSNILSVRWVDYLPLSDGYGVLVNTQNPEDSMHYNTQTIWFNATTHVPVSTCVYSLDGGTNITMDYTNGVWNKLNSSMTEKTHTAVISCTDTLSITGENTTTFTIDLTNPTVEIIEPYNITYNTSMVNLNVSADEPTSKWHYSLNDGSAVEFTPNTTINSLSNNPYKLEVTATDLAGNNGTATQYFTVDEATQLTISDIDIVLTDNRWTDATFTIFADYEYTNGTNVEDTVCSVTGDLTGTLTYNGTEYIGTALMSSVGSYSYTIECSKEFHVTQSDTDLFTSQNAISCGFCGLGGTCDYFTGVCSSGTAKDTLDLPKIIIDFFGHVGYQFVLLMGLIVIILVSCFAFARIRKK